MQKRNLFFSRGIPRVFSPLSSVSVPFFSRFSVSFPRVPLFLIAYFSINHLFSLLARRTVKFQKPLVKREKICYNTSRKTYRGVVQLVESRSPKPLVLGSSPSAPAKNPSLSTWIFSFVPQEHHLAIGNIIAPCAAQMNNATAMP